MTGDVELTLHLDGLYAERNPELLGRAEYSLRVDARGLERWRSDKLIRVGQGGTVPIDARFSLDVPASESHVDIAAYALERDLFNRDDRSQGRARLFRSTGFGRDTGLKLRIEGDDTALELHCRVTLSRA